MADLYDVAHEAIASDYDLLRDDSGIIEIDSYAPVTFFGEDRKGWLQGQVTNDLRSFTPGSAMAFCVCEPTGQLLTVADAWALTDRFVLTLPRVTLEAMMRRIETMVVLEDVVGEDSSSDYWVLSVQGPTATRRLGERMALPTLDAIESRLEDAPVLCLRSNRTGLGGWDLWVPRSAPQAREVLVRAFRPVSSEAYYLARLEAGIPLFGADMTVRTLPPEMGAAFEAKHISYTKGCYTGQEVLVRMHSRGHTNRTWVGLMAEEPLEIGATIAHLSRSDAGIVTSAAYSPDYGYIGAAMLRNEAAYHGETVRVTSERGEVEAEVRQMPFLRLD